MSYFMIAMDESDRLARERMREIAVAVRYGSNASSDEWQKFINSDR